MMKERERKSGGREREREIGTKYDEISLREEKEKDREAYDREIYR